MTQNLTEKALEKLDGIAESIKDLGERVDTIEEKQSDDNGVEDAKAKLAELETTVGEVKTAVGEIRVGADSHEQKVADQVGYEALARSKSVFDLIPSSVRRATAEWLQSKVLVGSARQSKNVSALLEKMENIEKQHSGLFIRPLTDDERAKFAPGHSAPVQRIALEEGVAAEGGDLVPTPFESVVLRLAEDASVVRGLATRVPMTAVTHQVPARDTAPTAAIIDEEATIPDAWSSGPFSQKNLTAKKIGCLTDVSGELAQDNSVLLMQLLALYFGEAVGLEEDSQALEGTGAGSNFTGLVAEANVNEVTNGANGSAPTYAKLVEQVYKAVKRASRSGATWVMHPTVLEKIVGLEDGSGNPVLQRNDVARVLSANIVGPGFGEGTILGYPVYTSDQIAINRTVGTSNDCSNIYFGPFGMFNMIFGNLRGFEIDSSDAPGFKTWQITVRGFERLGILVGVGSAFTKQTGVKTT